VGLCPFVPFPLIDFFWIYYEPVTVVVASFGKIGASVGSLYQRWFVEGELRDYHRIIIIWKQKTVKKKRKKTIPNIGKIYFAYVNLELDFQ
jgi:hypothetical protein